MRKEEKTELTKKKIIDLAIIEFGENGYLGASLNSICAKGIPKGLLYHNFKNKDAVYLACLECCYSALTESMKNLKIDADIQKYMNVRMKFFSEHRHEAQLFFETIIQPPENLRCQISKIRKDFDLLNIKLYTQMLSKISLRKEISKEEAIEYFSMLQNMFNAYFSSEAFQTMSFSDKVTAHEEKLSRLLDFMLYGIIERGTAK